MIELLRKRRSIRSYTGDVVPDELVDLLVEGLLRSPSSRNIDPWAFIVVDDKSLLARLAEAKEHGSSFVKKASLAIVICADSTKSDVWVEDCSIASILVQMVAESVGLGSCWIQIRKRNHGNGLTAEQYVRELLGLPEQIVVESIISIGYPSVPKIGIPAERLDYNKVKHNHYSIVRKSPSR